MSLTIDQVRALVTSGCDTAGHCEHALCCYCIEARRVAAEAFEMMK